MFPLLTKQNKTMKNVKNIARVAVVAFAAAVITTSCGVISAGSALYGGLFTKIKAPMALNVNEVGTKVGTSHAIGVLGLVGIGDYGYNEAIKNGNIKKVSHVDYEVFSVLGLFSKVTTYVYGN